MKMHLRNQISSEINLKHLVNYLISTKYKKIVGLSLDYLFESQSCVYELEIITSEDCINYNKIRYYSMSIITDEKFKILLLKHGYWKSIELYRKCEIPFEPLYIWIWIDHFFNDDSDLLVKIPYFIYLSEIKL